jgi:hypothetical protein
MLITIIHNTNIIKLHFKKQNLSEYTDVASYREGAPKIMQLCFKKFSTSCVNPKRKVAIWCLS